MSEHNDRSTDYDEMPKAERAAFDMSGRPRTAVEWREHIAAHPDEFKAGLAEAAKIMREGTVDDLAEFLSSERATAEGD